MKQNHRFRTKHQKIGKTLSVRKKDVKLAIEALSENPNLGVLIPNGFGVRKLRVRNSDAKRGKSGGYRLLYYVEDRIENRLYLLLLYSKSDKEDITIQELRELMEESDE